MSGHVVGEVEALLEAGQAPEAARRLTLAAAAGEAEAMAALARWRVKGDVVRRDLAAARALFARAGAAGNAAAALIHAYFLASGTGGAADWPGAVAAVRKLAGRHEAADRQLALLDKMTLNAEGTPPAPPDARTLSGSPCVLAAANFATAAECEHLLRVVEAEFRPSVVIDPDSGRLVPHPVRTSDGAFVGVFAEDLVVNALNRRIAALSGTRFDQGETLQLLRYAPGAQYRAHFDALAGDANQRVATVLVYLTDDYEGGETQFVRTGLAYRGRTGDALLFRNVDAAGRPDPMALHAGLPVTRGVKIIASRWIRSERFTYPSPRPLLDL
jgi:prolyl 4-hydroxylase